MRKKSPGFSLIELIVVIVILGVLATAISSFIKFATQIYSETTARDQLVSSARFAIERLNRDIRNALPNSLRLTNSEQCLEFTPIIESTIYTDIPVAPEVAKNKISVIRFDKTFKSTWSVIVYPLTPNDVYPVAPSNSDKVHAVASIDETGDEWVITLVAEVLFSEDSPTQRLYFINESETVEYCLQNNSLLRNGILMAEDIYNTSPFEILAATLQRNAMVQMHFRFEKNNETVTFNNEIQVLNVP
ncbi:MULTISPECIES: PilW family protein [Colwellia]|nr:MULTISPECIES: type II secretion system protein [Colwellia]